jgi:hypothetical protein
VLRLRTARLGARALFTWLGRRDGKDIAEIARDAAADVRDVLKP